MKKIIPLLLSLFLCASIAHAITHDASIEMPHELAVELQSEAANIESILDDLIQKGMSLMTAVSAMIKAAPTKAARITAIAIKKDSTHAAAIAAAAVSAAPSQANDIVVAALIVSPEQVTAIVAAANAASIAADPTQMLEATAAGKPSNTPATQNRIAPRSSSSGGGLAASPV